MNAVPEAVREVLAHARYRVFFAVGAVLSGVAYVLVPVVTIPGNSVELYFAISPWWNYLLLLLFSLGTGLLVALQAMRASNGARKFAAVGKVIPAFIAGAYSTAACAGCIAAFGSLLGAGGALFLLNYRSELVTASVLLLVLSVYSSSKSVSRCDSCAGFTKQNESKVVK